MTGGNETVNQGHHPCAVDVAYLDELAGGELLARTNS